MIRNWIGIGLLISINISLILLLLYGRHEADTLQLAQYDRRDVVTPRDFGAVNDGVTDDTRALNDALAKAGRKTLLLNGAYGVSKLELRGSPSAPINIIGNAVFNGISSSTQPAILDVSGSVNISGQIDVYGEFRPNYGACIWFHGAGGTPAQFASFNDVSPAGCLIGWRIGDVAYPNAIVSEVSIFGGHTYGTPVAAQVEGTNTVVSFIGTSPLDGSLGSINTPGAGWFEGASVTRLKIASSGANTFLTQPGLPIAMGMPISAVSMTSIQNYMIGTVRSYDGRTGVLVIDTEGAVGSGEFSSWQLSPPTIGIRAIGAQVHVVGGEVQQGQQFGSLVEMRPLEATLGDKHGHWPIVGLRDINADNTGLILSTINPGTVGIDSSFYGTLILDGLNGYAGYDLSPALNTSSDFYGKIFIQKNNLLAPSARSNSDIIAGSPNTIIYTDVAGLGINFRDSYCGIGGGTVLTWASSQSRCH